MRKSNLHLEAITPNRVVLEVKSLHTPVNSKGPAWSPSLHAETPDLNVTVENLERTPALLKSLGILTEGEDANVSWRSCMATPSSEIVSPNATVFHTPDYLESKPEVIQNDQIFQPLDSVNNSMHRSSETCQKYACIHTDFLTNKPASKFVYPKPVYIEIEDANKQIPEDFHPSKGQQKTTLEFTSYSDEESAHSPVLTIRRKIRKSLKFGYESYGESSNGDRTSPSCGSPVTHSPLEETVVLRSKHDDAPISFKSVNFDLLGNSQKLPPNFDGNHIDMIGNLKCIEHIQLTENNCDCLITTESKGLSTTKEEYLSSATKALRRGNSFFEDFDNLEKNSVGEKDLGKLHTILNSTLVSSKLVIQLQDNDSSSLDTDTNVNWQKKEFGTPEKNPLFASGDKTSIHSLSCEVGFSTAAGKAVSISEQALTRARALFENDQPSSKTNHLNASAGFGTASGKYTTVTEDSLLRANRSFVDTQPATDPDSSKNVAFKNDVGFTTAAGKAVLISDQALTRAKALFENDQPPPKADDIYPGTKSSNVNKKRIPVSGNSLSGAHTLFEETKLNVGLDSVKNIATKSEIGFNTAAGKVIAISEQALSRAKAVFESKEAFPQTSGMDSATELNYTSGKQITISATSTLRAKVFFEETTFEVGLDPIRSTTATNAMDATRVGFSTAAGKAVSISNKALTRAKALFESEQSSQIIDMNSQTGVRADRVENYATSEKSLFGNKASFHETILTTIPSTSKNMGRLSKQSSTYDNDSGGESYHRKRKMEDDNSSDDWASSPTIGKKKRKDSPSIASMSSENLLTQTPISAFDCDPTNVLHNILSLRKQARHSQKSSIEAKKNRSHRIIPKDGALYSSTKNCSSIRRNWVQYIGQSVLPETCPVDQLLAQGVTASVCLVSSANSASFTFYGWEYFSVEACRNNSQGFQLGEFLLIMADNNTISCEEIGNSLLALESVDPSLISLEWIRNHFRWIVWKLASMEIRLPDQFAQQCLTPLNVLDQLKYRYDREIDRCERSALKRIIEQDDAAAKTLILCVATIDEATSILELTDGWYSITARCDGALKQLIANKKIFIGVKLIISGAELVSPGPTSPLDIGSDTYLKISANSCRRARWDSPLGFCRRPQPILVSLQSVLPEGGLISHLKVVIVRVYPLVYMGKTAEGKTQFRSERCYRKESESAALLYERMMEKIMEDVEREEEQEEKKDRRNNYGVELTGEEKRSKIIAKVKRRMENCTSNPKPVEWVPLLKLRIVNWNCYSSNSAMLSVWRPTENVQHCLKENQSYHLYHIIASGIRFGELQLNSLKQTRWQEIKNGQVHEFERSVTSFQTANQPGFKPPFNELDVVGLVVFVAQQPNKNSFQTAVLSDGVNYFGIKCWISFDDYALTNVIVTGSFLSFSNLQWRSLASKDLKIPFAFIHEGTLVSPRPTQKHLESSLNSLKKTLCDPCECISQAALHVNSFFGNIAPNSVNGRYSIEEKKGMYTPTCSNEGKNTPSNATASNPSVCRTRLLEKYGTPPSLSPWIATPSPDVRHRFKPPAKTTNK